MHELQLVRGQGRRTRGKHGCCRTRGGGARNGEADKAGFGLVNGSLWMGIKGFSTEEDKEKINFSYITKRMR